MIKLLGNAFLSFVIAAALVRPSEVWAEVPTNVTPDFQEVFNLIRDHLAGESEADLNREAVMGLLDRLHARVSLAAGKTSIGASNAPLVIRSNLFDTNIVYLAVGRVGDGLSDKLVQAYKGLIVSNLPAGLVLDLRFAGGESYASAADASDIFITRDKPLIDWGKGMVQSKDKTNAITVPLAVLVNQHTTGAAEALAELLRENCGAILLGTTTAGEATMSKEFSLKNGQTLLIATTEIKMGNGQTLSSRGVKPDIEVSVRPESERVYFADPFKEIGAGTNGITGETGANTGTNRIVRAHQLTEAELIRVRKSRPGVDVDDLPLASSQSVDIEKPVVHDPALGRALDLVKGIAALRR